MAFLPTGAEDFLIFRIQHQSQSKPDLMRAFGDGREQLLMYHSTVQLGIFSEVGH